MSEEKLHEYLSNKAVREVTLRSLLVVPIALGVVGAWVWTVAVGSEAAEAFGPPALIFIGIVATELRELFRSL